MLSIKAGALSRLCAPVPMTVAMASSVGTVRKEVRHFGRHPKKDVPRLPTDRVWPAVKDITSHVIKPIKRREWMSQDLPYIKGESKESRKERRAEYLFKRSLPPPQPNAVLHGSHARLSAETTFRRWWFIDAENKVMGRIAQEIGRVILGKHKPIYDPTLIMGDYVVVVNVDKMAITGKKLLQRKRTYHTGYIGNLVQIPYKDVMADRPEALLRMTIASTLPRNNLRRERLKLARLFAGPVHPHANEDLHPMPSFLKVPSPWVKPKEYPEGYIVPGSAEDVLQVFAGEDDDPDSWVPLEDMVDNTGKKWNIDDYKELFEEGQMLSEEALKEEEEVLKMIPNIDK